MTPHNLPRHYDAWKLRGPDERDENAETEARNERAERQYREMVDDEMREAMERKKP